MTDFPSAAAMPSASDEDRRAAALRRYGILDTEAERAFDDLTALASQLCAAPAAIITFIDGDRLWFKSTYGLTAREAPVEHSFCAHAAGAPGEVFVIGDALADGRFLENVFVMPQDGLRAYAGANVVEPGGTALGSICVVDFEPRAFTDAQREALERLSRQVVDQLELRLRVRELDRERERLRRANEHMQTVSYAIAHDLRAPLSRQGLVVGVLEEDFGALLPEDGRSLLRLLGEGAADTIAMAEALLRYLRDSEAAALPTEEVDLREIFATVERRLGEAPGADLDFDRGDVATVTTQPAALEHILLNLVSNACRYVDREDGRVDVSAEPLDDGGVAFCVADNGPGIPTGDRARVFELFARGADVGDRGGQGVGLALTKRLALALGGDVTLEDNAGGGCLFKVRLPGPGA